MRLRSRALPSALACVVLALLGVLSVLALPTPARAITTGATVNVVIDDLSPVTARPSSTLRLAGRIANASPTAVTDLRVRLRVSSAPISERDGIAATSAAPITDASDGIAVDATGTAVTSSLAPGGEAMFTLSTPMAGLGLGAAGAYVISVEAIGSQGGAAERLGIQRTFLPWFPDGTAAAPATPLQVVWLWPLVEAPARTATGAFVTDALPQALGSDGRLGRLVAIGDDAPVSWVVDPSLLQSAAVIGDGYQVERDGTLSVGDAGANGPAWLKALGRAAGTSPLHLLPYADIDATASRRAGLGTDVTQAITLAPEVAAAALATATTPTGTTASDGLAWMPAIDRQTANLLVTSGVRSVVLRERSLVPDPTGAAPGVVTIGTIAGPLTAVLADDVLSDLVSVPTRTNAEALLVRQQVLAHLAVVATAQASGAAADDPRRVVIAPSIAWDPEQRLVAPLLRATRTAPWLAPLTLDRLLDAPRSPRQRLTYSADEKRAEVPAEYLAAVSREQSRLAALAAVLDDPTPVVEPFGQALLRAQSIAWRTEPSTARSLLTSIRRELVDRTDAVHVLSRGSIVFSGDVGAVPVTIENDLDSDVTVGVQLIGEPAARLSSAPLQGIRIEAGHRVSVDLDARVIGGDPLTARVQLLTPEGARYGTPSRVTLSSTAYARAASWVVIAAFVAIAIFVVVGITRRIRKARAGA